MFGENNKWGYFPAVSAGVDIAKLFKLEYVQQPEAQGQLRRNWLIASNSWFVNLRRLVLSDHTIISTTKGSYFNAYGPTNRKPGLKVGEKGGSRFRLDVTALNNRLTGTVDWYKRNTSDLIFSVTVPVPPNLVPLSISTLGTLKAVDSN